MAASKSTQQAGDYLVLAVGAGYRAAGDATAFALRGNIVPLSADEAERLSGLGAVREASAEEKTRAEQVFAAAEVLIDLGPAENPYGGTPLVDPETHAAEQIAETRRKK